MLRPVPPILATRWGPFIGRRANKPHLSMTLLILLLLSHIVIMVDLPVMSMGTGPLPGVYSTWLRLLLLLCFL
jgi:hypothetical protein